MQTTNQAKVYEARFSTVQWGQQQTRQRSMRPISLRSNEVNNKPGKGLWGLFLYGPMRSTTNQAKVYEACFSTVQWGQQQTRQRSMRPVSLRSNEVNNKPGKVLWGLFLYGPMRLTTNQAKVYEACFSTVQWGQQQTRQRSMRPVSLRSNEVNNKPGKGLWGLFLYGPMRSTTNQAKVYEACSLRSNEVQHRLQ